MANLLAKQMTSARLFFADIHLVFCFVRQKTWTTASLCECIYVCVSIYVCVLYMFSPLHRSKSSADLWDDKCATLKVFSNLPPASAPAGMQYKFLELFVSLSRFDCRNILFGYWGLNTSSVHISYFSALSTVTSISASCWFYFSNCSSIHNISDTILPRPSHIWFKICHLIQLKRFRAFHLFMHFSVIPVFKFFSVLWFPFCAFRSIVPRGVLRSGRRVFCVCVCLCVRPAAYA